MSIKKSLLGLAATAMVTMAFASPAMATTDGSLVHHTDTTKVIPPGTILHLIGWTKFASPNGSYTCHVTWSIEMTGTTGSTGDVRASTLPDTTKCTGTGLLNGCKVKTHQSQNLPYHLTVTSNGRVDITGTVVIHIEFSNCLVRTILMTLTSGTELTPLKTGERVVTGTENRLGTTANLKETIAGFEIDSAFGLLEIVDIFGGKSEEAATTSGELEITGSQRCTWEIIED